MKTKKLLPVIYFVLICSVKLVAQREANYWYFGINAGINFNSGAPVADTAGALNTDEGCATISDSAGNLLFYTEGRNVWNKLHTLMPNGTGLTGDWSSSQSAIIVPKPGSPTVYYVFTTAQLGGTDGLRYSEIDLSLDGGLGDVTAIKNIPLFTPVAEKVTAVKNADGVNFWVIAHNNNTADYLVYAVTSAGVTATPIISTTGSIDASTDGIGYMKASRDGSKLVTAMTYSAKVDVLNFNTSTGIVSLDFGFVFESIPYGVEFSPNCKRLYIGSLLAAIIYQYDMTLGSSTAILASATAIRSYYARGFGALQNAPDNKMYIVRSDDTLSCITYPDSLVPGCGFIDNAVSLSGRMGQLGLPNFISGLHIVTPFKYENLCLGDTTLFSPIDSITVDSIHWNFGDPASGIYNDMYAYHASHVFSAPGSYPVSVITYQGVTADTIRSTVTILGAPSIFIGNDTAICAGDSITLDAGSGYFYRWQDGSTNQTFRAAAGATYYVNATRTCAAGTDTIHITAIPLPPVILNDQSICIGQTASLNVHGAASYVWQTGITATDSTAMVSPTVTTSYSVTGTSAAGCSAADTATVTVNALPLITVNTASICPGDTAALIANGAIAYVWSTNETTAGIQIAPAITTTYTVTGTNAAGCMDSAITNVIVNPLPVITTTGDVTIIAGTSTTLQAGGGTSYSWTPALESGCNDCPGISVSPLKTTVYCVEVNNGTCTDSTCITVTVILPCSEIQVPDAFSPNDDGNNDNFLVQGWDACVNYFSITIYDRWGEKVFESENVNFRWDGTCKNTMLDPAVFVYYIKARLMDNTSIERKGNITLIR